MHYSVVALVIWVAAEYSGTAPPRNMSGKSNADLFIFSFGFDPRRRSHFYGAGSSLRL